MKVKMKDFRALPEPSQSTATPVLKVHRVQMEQVRLCKMKAKKSEYNEFCGIL